MKKQLLVCLLVLYSLPSFAQDKAMLTKEETINYINKKSNECEEHTRTIIGTGGIAYTMHYWDLQVSLSNDKVVLYSKSSNYSNSSTGDKNCSDYFTRVTTQTFNPAHIVSITDGATNKNEPLGSVIIKLVSKTGVANQQVHKYTWNNGNGTCSRWGSVGDDTYSVNEIGLGFLQSDPTNFNKIKKALEHLKALYKAEDDPFGD